MRGVQGVSILTRGVTASPAGGVRSAPPPLRASGNMTMLMITIDGGTLSYDVSGAGPPIVFVAGLGEHGTYWMAQVAAFSSAFQVVTFDHGGVGASEGQPPYKVEQWAADTLRLIDHLGLDRVHLVGHSTGGAIAQVLSADHPTVLRPSSSAQLGRGWTRDCASCSCSASERCTSRWVLIGAARPGTRRRKSRRRASTRYSLMTPESACGVSATRRC
jgi:pimeloyl-ACP methyl ester carboxylesterase